MYILCIYIHNFSIYMYSYKHISRYIRIYVHTSPFSLQNCIALETILKKIFWNVHIYVYIYIHIYIYIIYTYKHRSRNIRIYIHTSPFSLQNCIAFETILNKILCKILSALITFGIALEHLIASLSMSLMLPRMKNREARVRGVKG
jgi:hypothetical protein